jgi:hypothetical protein
MFKMVSSRVQVVRVASNFTGKVKMNQAAQPMTHLQQVLQYLKQGHATLPPQPIQVPQPNLRMPQAAPSPTMMQK